ncbi:hypothetical protein FQA39_LY03418 [Lamprigera yunnana]|nr:hypothetical protein FQA39_LY03418 [Lamprigera yunnana]
MIDKGSKNVQRLLQFLKSSTSEAISQDSLDTDDSQGQEEALNVDTEREDNSPAFRTPRYPPKRDRKNENSPAQEAVNCMQSLSKIVTTRVENSVFREYVANEMRNCNRPRVEVSIRRGPAIC